MRSISLLLPPALLLLAACEDTGTTQRPMAAPALPEAVRAIADPTQDLSTAYLRPSDGCYWYRYDGPVETTDLPLRSTGGAAICTRPAEPTAPAATG